ncbi:MAG TPA: CpaF family protein [Alphaproteobacteria bacterium]|nr:CpaF family protein [Alphaproteobacteria bacterium]
MPDSGDRPANDADRIDQAIETIGPKVAELLSPEEIRSLSRGELAKELEKIISQLCADQAIELNASEMREVTTVLLNDVVSTARIADHDPLLASGSRDVSSESATIEAAKEKIQPRLMEHIDASAAAELTRQELAEQIGDIVGELLVAEKINLNLKEQRELVTVLLNDMLGLGPLEPLLADESVTDIMVNGPKQVYVERKGKLTLTDVIFRDNSHLMNIAQRIVTQVGRRVDETSPLCDARLADGSRVNVIIPPLAIDGASISIRKFSKKSITLDKMVETQNLSRQMCTILKIAAACRLNILISGGTGSGKTTLLNAMSRMIDPTERVVTIEDAAELQLQQPHVVRLETRPANLEGEGKIDMRDLVKNALRMRPDRIILGEIRGEEALDVLQAMNTGHDGSMTTIHANRPREALTRLENMVGMGGINLPSKAIRTQIASAVNMIVQIARMRDGVRRIQQITEIVGMEGDVITTQDLFTYRYDGEHDDGTLKGDFVSGGLRPHFTPRAEYFGLHRALVSAI